ncbi:hypothetical protein C3495_07220 [Clostridiaceae bacterium 14S0207]|nr:hypothetical protein C3495_07220 [Clostridiaceae bacterium 14S0207]
MYSLINNILMEEIMDNVIDLYNFDFTDKVVLEIGTGRGGTTIELVKILQNFNGAKLITTDIYDGNFESIKEKISNYKVPVSFVRTDACELAGIEEDSIDFIVCNYTICAINSRSGRGVIALNKFKKVLKVGGKLYIEEEYPITDINNPMQEVWAKKWRLLKSVNMFLGELPYNEIEPEILKDILEILEFKDVKVESSPERILGEDCLEFFNYRFKILLNRMKNLEIIQGLIKEEENLQDFVKKTKGMEIPVYKIMAVKE